MRIRRAIHQLRYEQRSYWRNPAGVFFTIALPVVMLSIFTTLNEGDVDATGASFARYFVPGMATFGVITAAYGNLAARIVARRETGLFKRVRATPTDPRSIVAGLIAHAVVIAVLIATIVTIVGRVAFDVPLPERLPLYAATILVGSASFAALGAAISTVIPNIEAADAIVFATFLPVCFISGIFDDVPDGSLLDDIAGALPVRHLFDIALASGGGATDGVALRFLVVLAWGAVGAVVAARRFKWEPRAGR